MEQGKNTNHEDGIVYQGGNTTETETPVLEANQDVEEHDYQTTDNGQDSITHQVVGDGSTHLLGLDDTEGIRLCATEILLTDIVGEVALYCTIEFANDFVIHLLAIFIDFILSGDLQLSRRSIGFHLGGLTKFLVKCGTDFDSIDWLVETDHIGTSTREIDTGVETTGHNTTEADNNGHDSNDIESFTFANEVNMNILHEVLGERE